MASTQRPHQGERVNEVDLRSGGRRHLRLSQEDWDICCGGAGMVGGCRRANRLSLDGRKTLVTWRRRPSTTLCQAVDHVSHRLRGTEARVDCGLGRLPLDGGYGARPLVARCVIPRVGLPAVGQPWAMMYNRVAVALLLAAMHRGKGQRPGSRSAKQRTAGAARRLRLLSTFSYLLLSWPQAKRRARGSNPQPVNRHLISNQAASAKIAKDNNICRVRGATRSS